ELSSAMYSLIKTENGIVDAYEKAAHQLTSVAHQLSAWGEATEDEHISDISDKLGVLMSELADVEENFAAELEDSRVTLKQIRNTESSVQPSRDQKQKLIDQIHTLKHKDPQSPKLVDAEQALVRAEAENLVAEAQLTNIQRHALKETYLLHFQAIIERAEKSLILADHGRRVLELLDDTPVVPGDSIAEYTHEREAKQILLDCESELQAY
ncbi:Eisosome component PIL1/LSP1, partial [Protomyces lactucae-debilis]